MVKVLRQSRCSLVILSKWPFHIRSFAGTERRLNNTDMSVHARADDDQVDVRILGQSSGSPYVLTSGERAKVERTASAAYWLELSSATMV